MKRFIAILNDNSFINIPATRMELKENSIIVWEENDLVAFVDVSVILCAHISEKTT